MKALSLSATDPQILAIPKPPVGTIRLYTTAAHLLPRDESVRMMSAFDYNRSSLFDLRKSGNEVSAILELQGVSLKKAEVMYEGRVLSTLDISANAKFPEKVFPDGALLVLDSTRGNTDWRDVNLRTIEEELGRSSSSSNGTLFVRITDGFGRHADLGLVHLAWTRVDSDADGVNIKTVVMHEWFD